MTSEIIISVVSIVISLMGWLISTITNNKITAQRVKTLEQKVDKHNTIIERTYKLETKVEDMQRIINKLE